MAGVLELERLLVRLMADSSQYDAVMRQAEAKVTQMAQRLTQVGKSLSLAFTVPLAAIGVAAVKAFSDFDDAMTKSLAIMGDVSEGMKKQMEQTALAISASSVTAPAKVAEAYYFLASAGLTAADAMASLNTVEKFSVAGAFDMARATEMLADAQSALGMRSKDTQQNMENMARIADVLTKANNMANGSTEQFAKALTTKSAAAMRMNNIAVEEGVAVLAAYHDQGIKAELAGERLSILIRDLQTEAIKHEQAWSKMGLAVFDSAGKMRHLADIVEDVDNRLGGLSDREKKYILLKLGFSDRSMSAITSLLGVSDKIRDYETQLKSAGGTTQEVADKQMKSFASQMLMLWNNIKIVGIEIGRVLAPYVLKLNEYIKAGIAWWQGLSTATKEAIIKFGVIVAAIGPIITAFGLLSAAAVAAFPLIIEGLTVIGILVGTGVLGANVATLIGLLVGPEGLAGAWEYVKDTAMNAILKILGFVYNLEENFHVFIDWISENWIHLWEDAGNIVWVFSKNILKTLLTIMEMFAFLIAYTAAELGSVFINTGKLIITFLGNLISNSAKALMYVGELFWGWLKELGNVFLDAGELVGTFLLNMVKNFGLVAMTINDLMVKAVDPRNWFNPQTFAATITQALSQVRLLEGMEGQNRSNFGRVLDETKGPEFSGMLEGANFNPVDFTRPFSEAKKHMQANLPKGMLDGFESSLTGLPEFKTELPPDIMDALNSMGKTAQSEERILKGSAEPPPDFGKDSKREQDPFLKQDHGNAGDTFKEFSLRRFMLDGPGGLSRGGTPKAKPIIEAPKMEQKLDRIIQLQEQGTPIVGN